LLLAPICHLICNQDIGEVDVTFWTWLVFQLVVQLQLKLNEVDFAEENGKDELPEHQAAVIAAHSVVFQLPNIKSLIASCTQALFLIQFSVSKQDQLPPEVAIVRVALPLPSIVNSYTQGVVGLLGTLLPEPDGVYGLRVATPQVIVRI
jgi:hypothetical protein